MRTGNPWYFEVCEDPKATEEPVRVTTVFNKLLDLQGAFVRRVEFTAGAIVVAVRRRARLHRCPYCSFSCRARNDRGQREWRHVSLGKWRVVIRAVLCRLECPEHGVVTETVPWAEHESRFTRDFEDLVAWLTREMNKTAVKTLMRIAWATVGNIIERVVARRLDPDRLRRLYVGDEREEARSSDRARRDLGGRRRPEIRKAPAVPAPRNRRGRVERRPAVRRDRLQTRDQDIADGILGNHRPGFGGADAWPIPYRVPLYSRFLSEFIERLVQAVDVVAAGHSAGTCSPSRRPVPRQNPVPSRIVHGSSRRLQRR